MEKLQRSTGETRAGRSFSGVRLAAGGRTRERFPAITIAAGEVDYSVTVTDAQRAGRGAA